MRIKDIRDIIEVLVSNGIPFTGELHKEYTSVIFLKGGEEVVVLPDGRLEYKGVSYRGALKEAFGERLL